MCCISSSCIYFKKCQRSAYFTQTPSRGINWESFGSGHMTENKFEVYYHCGERGNYKMYIPILKEGDKNN